MGLRLLLVLCFSSFVLSQDVTVKLPLGSVKGLKRSTVKGTSFYSFQGIPYAEKPVGDLRFQAPVSKKKWDGTWDATKEGSICHQMKYEYKFLDQNEDCLFINIFTPNISANLPVMFYVYGGGFIIGTSSEDYYGPYFLMEENVVLVTFNYRVGPYGFLSTGDDFVPGNAGLKDQNLALKWVNQYVSHFGGDPTQIVIFGQSAGSASCLFRGAILLSGTTLSPWAYQRNHQLWSRNLIKLMDPTNYEKYNTSKTIYEYLKQAPAELINDASNAIQKGYKQLYQGFFFAPVYEHEHDGAFITKRAYEALEEGDFNKVPVLLGATSEEDYFYMDLSDDMHAIDENREKIKDEIMKFYMSGGKYADNVRKLITMLSDHDFVLSVLKFAEFLMKHSQNPYLYQFSYKGVLAGRTNQSEIGFSDKVAHAEELRYIFNSNRTKDITKFPEQDQITQDVTVKLPLGTVKGLRRSTVRGTRFYSFQGIPYAEKPVGDLRFQAPVAKKEWNGTWDATKEGSICNQMNYKSSDQSEDCL
ncbi:unnamed protein product [Callosobruchus maculatus]|uniref:Carboxylic ester hydrolase n=1 Tax=Callosobruchus maculatus TaxID=64391 RepID=A0A653DKD2_CALMS|nr:unnamed protein product [Callosobruchus maculatus]